MTSPHWRKFLKTRHMTPHDVSFDKIPLVKPSRKDFTDFDVMWCHARGKSLKTQDGSMTSGGVWRHAHDLTRRPKDFLVLPAAGRWMAQPRQ